MIAPPARREPERVAPGGSDVTRIGPTRHLPTPPLAAAADDEPPEGERERLVCAMAQCGGVPAEAARLLRVTPRQQGRALQKNRIEVRKF